MAGRQVCIILKDNSVIGRKIILQYKNSAYQGRRIKEWETLVIPLYNIGNTERGKADESAIYD